MILFPLGIDEAAVDRVPWVSIALAGLCFVAFGFTWIAPANPQGFGDEDFRGVIKYWQDHPYLEMPKTMTEHFLDPRVQPIIAATR